MFHGRKLIASPRHTIILIAIILAISGFGAYRARQAAANPEPPAKTGSALPLYLAVIAGEWGLLRYALVGTRPRGIGLRELIGGRWANGGDLARDVALGLGVWVIWSTGEAFTARALGFQTPPSVESLLPNGPAEIAAWVVLSISAGICEEAVFRGYLQKQFQAATGSAPAAIAAQALLFGVAHGYQGVRNVILIALLGAIFGWLAHWRRSLRPGIVLHAWTDLFSGIVARG